MLKKYYVFPKENFSYISRNGTLYFPAKKTPKKSPPEIFLVFLEMELSSSNIKKILIFPQKKAFLIFPQKKAFLIFPEMDPSTFYPKLKKWKKSSPWKLLMLQQTETLKAFLIFQETENLKVLLIFQEVTCKPRKPKKIILFVIKKQSFLN